jgi:hypothetical protein
VGFKGGRVKMLGFKNGPGWWEMLGVDALLELLNLAFSVQIRCVSEIYGAVIGLKWNK